MKTPTLGLPLIALILGVLGYASFSGLHPVAKPVLPGKAPEPNINFTDLSRNTTRLDQALLEDSAPLFLATQWNASFSPGAALSGDIAEVSIYPPELRALNSAFFIEGPRHPFATMPSLGISDGLGTLFSTFGRGKDQTISTASPMPKRGTLVISRMGITGEKHSFKLIEEVLRLSKTGIWPPVEFFCTVENLTTMGSPALTKSSGINELDEALSRFAQQKISNNGLPTGYYRIIAYP